MSSKFYEKSPMAFLAYLAISVILFGLPLLGDLSRSYIITNGADPRGFADPTAMMWFLAWWPYALSHGLNPFVTDMVWAPQGVNLTWATSIPGVSLLAHPITLAVGPVVTYNLLCVLAPALAGWTGYILCRRITKKYWPSLIGGYLFGFSTYELYHLAGHLSLTLIFIAPLLIYLVLLRLNKEIKPQTFVLFFGLALIFQFLISNEVFATVTLFGSITLLIAFLVFPIDVKKCLLSISGLILYAYVIATFVLSPYLYYSFVSGFPHTPIADPQTFSSDPLNFLIPTPITFVGYRSFVKLASHFPGEAGAYMGLPLFLIVLCFARTHWHKPVGKLLILSLIVVCLASLGPRLRIAGIPILSLPWKLVLRLPVINHALPARLTMLAFLNVAILVSIWLSSAGSSMWAKRVLVSLSIIFLLPNVSDSYLKSSSWWKSVLIDTPPFFTKGLYKNYLCPGEITVIIPYGDRGQSMLWQAQSGFYFRMAGGYVNLSVPLDFWRWPILDAFYTGKISFPEYGAQLRTFLSTYQVRTIILAEETQGPWKQLFSTLEVVPINVGGVILYRVSDSACTLRSPNV